MTDEILEPVLNDKNELSWLTRHYEKRSTKDTNRPMGEIIKESAPLVDVPIYSLKPHGLWKCRKCGAETQSITEKPDYCKSGDHSSTFERVTKIIKPDLWKIPHWEDIEINKKELYENMLTIIKNLIVFSDEIEYQIYTLWIMSTWKLEAWDTVGYPVFIGIPNSGKSQALLVIHNLGYRAPKASGVKSASIPRLCHYYNVTLLIDECHNKLNPKTETGSELIDFCKDSYKRGSVYITCDNDDQEELKVTRNFGFKASGE
jgi:hypothetical protein